MDLKAKIIKALSEAVKVDYVRLEDDDGISGFVVSSHFKGMNGLDRQELIDAALLKASDPLTPAEFRRVLMIAAVTPLEYYSVGVPIRVHQIKEMAGGTVGVFVYGSPSDAEYVRKAVNNQKGVRTTEPAPVPGAEGVMMTFQVTGTASSPLTKAKVLRALKKDRYIEVMPKA